MQIHTTYCRQQYVFIIPSEKTAWSSLLYMLAFYFKPFSSIHSKTQPVNQSSEKMCHFLTCLFRLFMTPRLRVWTMASWKRLACNILYTFPSHRVPPCLLPSATRKGEWINIKRKSDDEEEEEDAEGRIGDKTKTSFCWWRFGIFLLYEKTRKVGGRISQKRTVFPFIVI